MRSDRNSELNTSRPSVEARPVDRDELAFALLIGLGAILWFSDFLPVSLAALGCAGCLALWSPVAAAWSICAALPTVAHPVSIGEASFTLLELSIVTAIAGFAGSVVIGALRNHDWPVLRVTPNVAAPLFGGVALLAAGILSLRFQLDPTHRDEALRVFRWTIVEPLLAFIAIRHAIQVRGIKPLFWVLVVTGGVVAACSLGLLVLDPDRFEGDGVPRALGPYLHPNNLALYLERVFVLLAGAVILNGIRWSRWTGVLIGLMGVALLATLSRGMIPAVIAGIILAACLARNRRLQAGAVLGAIGGVVVLLIAVAQRSRADSLDDFVGERRYVWSAAWNMIEDYPVSGIGMDQFLYQHAPRYIAPEAWSERYLSHPHNLVLDAWLSLGVAGLLLVCSAIILLTLTATRMRNNNVDLFAGAALAALLTGLIHGLVDNGYFIPDLAAMTWILIAIITTGDAAEILD